MSLFFAYGWSSKNNIVVIKLPASDHGDAEVLWNELLHINIFDAIRYNHSDLIGPQPRM